jgi:hypothetical protein
MILLIGAALWAPREWGGFHKGFQLGRAAGYTEGPMELNRFGAHGQGAY